MGEGAGAEGEQGLGYWAAKLIALKQKKSLVQGEGALCFAVSVVILSLFTQQTPVHVSLLRRQAGLPVCYPHVSM